MFTRFSRSLGRVAVGALTMLLVAVSGKGAGAQGTPPATVANVTTPITTTGVGSVLQSVVDNYGNWLFVDWANGALYEYPANGTSLLTLSGPGTLGGVGGYQNPTVVIGANNDLYLAGNYSNCLLRFPYSASTQTWPGLATLTTSNQAPNVCGTAPYSFAQYGLNVTGGFAGYFQPWGVTVDKSNTLIIADQNSGAIFTLSVNGTGVNSTPGTGTVILSKGKKRENSLAVDPTGNIFFVEDSGGIKGAYMIPAGETGVASDADPSIVRVDPNLSSVTGVATDPSGNIYISDSSAGVYFVPNPSGVPNPSAAIQLTSTPATGQVSVDTVRGILYVPNTNSGSVAIALNSVPTGAVPVGTTAKSSSSVLFNFNQSEQLGSFVIQEAGVANPDFVLTSGGTCVLYDPTQKSPVVYAPGSSCSETVSLSPHALGPVSATLQLLQYKTNTVLASFVLQGTGTGSAVQVLPGGESAVGSGLKTPSQIALGSNGSIYVADPGLGTVVSFAQGSSGTTAPTAVATGLSSPTGVAVDGTGDLFVAGNGSVVEVPGGSSGLNAAAQTTLKTGLGTNLKLAADDLGAVYVADPDNHRVVALGGLVAHGNALPSVVGERDYTGFSAPSAIAVDQNADLFIADGANLYEVTPAGTQTTLLTTLSGATGLAVDPSGAVYVTMGGQTMRVPNVGGAITPASQTSIATDDTGATAVAVDASGNVYLTNTAAGNLDFVSTSAAYNFGTLTSTSGSAAQTFSVVDSGNLPLNITGFAATPDFSATATTCTGGPVGVGAACTVTVTFSPGPGDQGPLTGTLLVTGDEVNAPVGVNGTGVGAGLLGSTTALTVSTMLVNSTSVTVTVAPAVAGGITPTGQVSLVLTGKGLATLTFTGTLSNGVVTITPPQIPAGAYTFTANYIGDRVYGTSSASANVTVAASPITLVQPTMAQVQTALPTYPYILAAGAGAQEPYDGSVNQYEYTYPLQVLTGDAAPLIGVPVYDSKGKLVANNYGSISFTGVPAGSGCTAVPVAADGTAAFTTSCLSINTTNSSIPNILNAYTITPVYSGAGVGSAAGNTNPNYATVTGTPIAFTALRNPMVAISSNPSSISVTKGSSATATLTLTSILGYGIAGSGSGLNNYSLPLQLACDGLPAYATCSFTYANPDPSDPQSVDVGPVAGTVLSYRGAAAAPCTVAQGCVGPGVVTMTINTNTGTGLSASARRGGKSEAAYAAVFGLGLCGLVFGKRRSLRGRLMLSVCLLLCGGAMTGLSGCSTTQLGTSTATASPAGTYMVLVTAKQVGTQINSSTGATVYGNQNQMSLPFTINVTVQ